MLQQSTSRAAGGDSQHSGSTRCTGAAASLSSPTGGKLFPSRSMMTRRCQQMLCVPASVL